MKNSTEDNRSASCRSRFQGELKAYLDGELGVLRKTLIRRHVEHCRECSGELEQLASTSVLIKKAHVLQPPMHIAVRFASEPAQPVRVDHRNPRLTWQPVLAVGAVLATAAGAMVLVRMSPAPMHSSIRSGIVVHRDRELKDTRVASPTVLPLHGRAVLLAKTTTIRLSPDPTSAEADRLTREFFKSEQGKALLAASVNHRHVPSQVSALPVQVAMNVPRTRSAVNLLVTFAKQLGGSRISPDSGAQTLQRNELTIRVPKSSLSQLARGLARMNAGLVPVDLPSSSVSAPAPGRSARQRLAYPVMLPSNHIARSTPRENVEGNQTGKATAATKGVPMIVVHITFGAKDRESLNRTTP